MTTAKRSLRMLAMLAVLYAAAAFISVFAPDVFLLRHSSTLFLLALSLALTQYFADRIIDRETRGYLVAISRLITLWIVLRGAKYIAFEETGAVARHIWYLYYVPALLIPLLSLFAALSVGRRDWNRRPGLVRFAVCLTAALVLLILTNDLHQLAFRFQPGFADWDAHYARASVYVAAYIWIALLLLGTFCVLFMRCRVSASRRLIWIPALPLLFGAAYLALYALGLWPRVNGLLFGQFPETVCFMAAGIWLSLSYIGLIPSNAAYGKIFAISDLAAQIADRDYRVIYRSANAASLTAEQLASEAGASLDRNTRLHRKNVSGGFVYWQDDVAELNRVNAELWELGERLAEEAELVRLENKLKEERAQIEVKTRAYDGIAAAVLPQSREIAALCAEAERAPERFAANMKKVCLLAAYIKRYANLSLLTADRAALDTGELRLAVAESLRYVEELGVPVSESFSDAVPADGAELLSAYALFETLLEQALPTLRGVQASFAPGALRLVFEGAALALPEGCGASLTVEEDASFVRLAVGKAGEAP